MAVALGIPARRTGHFSRVRESLALEDCDVLLVVGTPTLRPEDVVRLARAYYHADPQMIDEASVRGEDGRWRYRDPRLQRVADALTRAELTQCAHRNRPLRYDGRVVVTLCADDVLYLPVTRRAPACRNSRPKACHWHWRVGLRKRRAWPEPRRI